MMKFRSYGTLQWRSTPCLSRWSSWLQHFIISQTLTKTFFASLLRTVSKLVEKLSTLVTLLHCLSSLTTFTVRCTIIASPMWKAMKPVTRNLPPGGGLGSSPLSTLRWHSLWSNFALIASKYPRKSWPYRSACSFCTWWSPSAAKNCSHSPSILACLTGSFMTTPPHKRSNSSCSFQSCWSVEFSCSSSSSSWAR